MATETATKTETKLKLDPPEVLQPVTAAEASGLVPLKDEGTVYPTARIADTWGTLSVTGGGVRVAADWKSAYVAAPASTKGDTLSGEGWTLQLAPGWSVQPGSRKGDLELRPTAGTEGAGTR